MDPDSLGGYWFRQLFGPEPKQDTWRKSWKQKKHRVPARVRGGWRTGRTPYFRYKMRRNRRKESESWLAGANG